MTIPAEDIIIVYDEQLKVGLKFLIDPFYFDVLNFHKLSIAQLHLNNWSILVAFWFICFNSNIEPTIAFLSQIYKLGTRVKEEYFFFIGKKRHTLYDRLPSSLNDRRTNSLSSITKCLEFWEPLDKLEHVRGTKKV